MVHSEVQAHWPLEATGYLALRAVAQGLLAVPGAPHGLSARHPQVFNDVLRDVLKR